MKVPNTEAEMVRGAVEYLKHRRFAAAVEVPLLHRSIDLVYRNEHEDLIAVEFKLRDWRRALRQAHDHQLGTEYAYVCLPRVVITQEIVEAARELGLGLLAWSEDSPLDPYLEPCATCRPLNGVREWLVQAFYIRRSEGVEKS